MSKQLNPGDEFLGFIEDERPGEKPDERSIRIGFLADLMTLAEQEQGIKLEMLVSQLEAHCLKIALEKFPGDLTRAALWLGYRPEALRYVLKRHPSIKA